MGARSRTRLRRHVGRITSREDPNVTPVGRAVKGRRVSAAAPSVPRACPALTTAVYGCYRYGLHTKEYCRGTPTPTPPVTPDATAEPSDAEPRPTHQSAAGRAGPPGHRVRSWLAIQPPQDARTPSAAIEPTGTRPLPRGSFEHARRLLGQIRPPRASCLRACRVTVCPAPIRGCLSHRRPRSVSGRLHRA